MASSKMHQYQTAKEMSALWTAHKDHFRNLHIHILVLSPPIMIECAPLKWNVCYFKKLSTTLQFYYHFIDMYRYYNNNLYVIQNIFAIFESQTKCILLFCVATDLKGVWI